MFPLEDVAERLFDALAPQFPEVAVMARAEIGDGQIGERGERFGPWSPKEQIQIFERLIDNLILAPFEKARELQGQLGEYDMGSAYIFDRQNLNEPILVEYFDQNDMIILDEFRSEFQKYTKSLLNYLQSGRNPDADPDLNDDPGPPTPTRSPS